MGVDLLQPRENRRHLRPQSRRHRHGLDAPVLREVQDQQLAERDAVGAVVLFRLGRRHRRLELLAGRGVAPADRVDLCARYVAGVAADAAPAARSAITVARTAAFTGLCHRLALAVALAFAPCWRRSLFPPARDREPAHGDGARTGRERVGGAERRAPAARSRTSGRRRRSPTPSGSRSSGTCRRRCSTAKTCACSARVRAGRTSPSRISRRRSTRAAIPGWVRSWQLGPAVDRDAARRDGADARRCETGRRWASAPTCPPARSPLRRHARCRAHAPTSCAARSSSSGCSTCGAGSRPGATTARG